MDKAMLQYSSNTLHNWVTLSISVLLNIHTVNSWVADKCQLNTKKKKHKKCIYGYDYGFFTCIFPWVFTGCPFHATPKCYLADYSATSNCCAFKLGVTVHRLSPGLPFTLPVCCGREPSLYTPRLIYLHKRYRTVYFINNLRQLLSWIRHTQSQELIKSF